MKLKDILQPRTERLDELNLKQAIAAGLIGASSISSALAGGASDEDVLPSYKAQMQQTGKIVDKYKVEQELANRIVQLAHKYEQPTFPQAKDILAVVGIESSFNPKAKSELIRDPALGLMQVRPGIWKINPKALKDVEQQIRLGSNILHNYYNQLGGNIEKAVQAYNLGITAVKQGKRNPQYLEKYRNEMRLHYDDQHDEPL